LSFTAFLKIKTTKYVDFRQAVTVDHPRALHFLVRDIANINRFFGTKCQVRVEREIFSEVTGIAQPEQITTIKEDEGRDA